MKKAVASVTVAASLLGGAAGAIVFAPSLVSAQADTQPETESDTASEAPTERGAWLAEVLDGLVEDGTLTADQADAVADAITEARPDRPEGHIGRGHRAFEGIAELSDLLGLEPTEIGDALRSGDSLADIAAAQGVDPQDLIDTMVDRAAERLDAAVAEGRIDEDAAAERLAEITERATDVVNGDAHIEGRRGRFGRFGDRGEHPFGPGPFGGDTEDEPADA